MSDDVSTAEIDDDEFEATPPGDADDVDDTEDSDLDDSDDSDDDADAADDDDDDDDFDDEYDEATAAERVLETCLRAIVDNPDGIDISVDERDRRLTLHVRVSGDDMGKIIGKRGRVANALRTLIKAAGSREGYNASVEIDD